MTVADVSLLADLHALKRDKLVKRAPPSLSLSTARPSHICGFDLGCSESALLAYCAYLGDCLEQHSHHQLLLQMAFANDSLPSSAVLQAMFALSCLYLERPANAKAHKARALSALRVAMGQTFGYVEQLQHIATHMLLCLLEVIIGGSDEKVGRRYSDCSTARQPLWGMEGTQAMRNYAARDVG